MENILKSFKKKIIYMCGYFNKIILNSDSNSSTQLYIDQMFSYGLRPLINKPTI